MTNKPIPIGILGGGGIFEAHAPAFVALGDQCRVVTVAEPDPARANRIRELLGAEVRIEKDYNDIIAAPDVAAVDILLPHHLHLPATLAAARAGKPVLVEKVMARNVAECDQMIDACERAGVSLTVCHDRRYHSDWIALKEIVESGALGEIFHWKLDHNQNVAFPEGHWARNADMLGGGAIMSCLTHQIDGLRWLGGEVSAVTCMTHTNPARMEGEFLGVIIAQMASGALAQLSINWWTDSHSAKNGLWYEMVQVCGTRGEMYMMHGKGTFIKLHGRPEQAILDKYGEEAIKGFVKIERPLVSGHQGCIREWVKSLRGDASGIITSGRECRGTVEVAEAAYRSAASGTLVSLPL